LTVSKPAIVDITLGATSLDSRVVIDGQDVSAAIHRILVECTAGESVRVELHLIPKLGGVNVHVAGALDHLQAYLHPSNDEGGR
jgi:hypothetical protein